MKRLAFVAFILTMVLVTLLAVRLQRQASVLFAPSGGSGVVEGTDYDLSSLVSARVEKVLVRKGQKVTAGQLLVALDCADVEASIGEVQARLALAKAQLEGARASRVAAARATGAAYAQISASRARTEALEARRAVADRNTARLAALNEAISPATVDDAKAASDSLTLERRASEDSTKAASAQAGVADAQVRAADTQVEAAAAAASAAEATLARAILLRRECTIKAPVDGLVEDVFVELGETPTRGSPLVRVVDIHEVKAIFYLPNAELALVQTDAPAVVVADAYPGREFPGAVDNVAVEAAFTPRNIQTRTDRDRLVYPVEVRIPNADFALRPGMPVEVRIPGTKGRGS